MRRREITVIIRRFEVGPLMVNSYIIGCEQTGMGAIVDPGADGEMLVKAAVSLGLKIQQIINTHGHADHIAANDEVKKLTDAKIFIHPLDAQMLTDPQKNLSIYFGPAIVSPPAEGFLEEDAIHSLGELEFEILHIPGHSSGSVCLFLDRTALVGDVLFAGSIGRTDFPGGSYDLLIAGIKTKLFPLGDKVEIYPGHGPLSTIGRERRHNPFLS
jgi:glyoxylase-like metal-dependent hydrolase (beta-lactamase superfamily II)